MKNPPVRAAFWIFVGFAALYIFSMGGHGYGGVGTTTYDVTRSILLRGSVAIEPVHWGKTGPDGQFYAQYGIGHSLYNIPFYLAGHFLTKLSPALAAQYDRLTMFTTLLGQPVISALTCALLFMLCAQLGYSRGTSLLCALLYGLGTQVWMYAQLDFSEPILTFFLLLSVYWLVRAHQTLHRGGEFRWSSNHAVALVLAGLCAGIAMSVKIVAGIVLPCMSLFLVFSSLKKNMSCVKSLAAFSVPLLLAGFGMVGAYNAIRFGTPLETGYGDEFTFHYGDVLRQFGDNLWSLEGSIVLYSPVILLGIAGTLRFYRRFRGVALLVFGSIGAFFLFYPFSTNELYYGPRYLTPTLPFFMLMAGSWLDTPPAKPFFRKIYRAAIIFLLFSGAVQQVVGVTVNYHSYYWRIQYALPLAEPEIRESEVGRLLRETPKLPHIAGHYWLLRKGLLGLLQPGGLPLEGVSLFSERDSARRNSWVPYYGLDFWWCHRQSISRFGPAVPLSVMIGLGGILWVSWSRVRKVGKSSV